MTLLKGIAIAFSMYSKIPMPKTKWDEKSMKYALCFFPLVGIVLGAVFTGIYVLMTKAGLGVFFRSGVLAVLPVIFTGGIHMDGFMDTKDAISSYQTRERRLEILKDSHIGAFAALHALCYLLLTFAAMTELDTLKETICMALCFVLSRTMSGLCFVTRNSAKKDGLQRTFASAMQKKAVMIFSAGYLFLVFLGLACFSEANAVILGLLTLLFYGYYCYFSEKNFGGITGDLAGYYLQIQELGFLLEIVLFFSITG